MRTLTSAWLLINLSFFSINAQSALIDSVTKQAYLFNTPVNNDIEFIISARALTYPLSNLGSTGTVKLEFGTTKGGFSLGKVEATAAELTDFWFRSQKLAPIEKNLANRLNQNQPFYLTVGRGNTDTNITSAGGSYSYSPISCPIGKLCVGAGFLDVDYVGQINLVQTPNIVTPVSSPTISELPKPNNFFSEVGDFLWEDMNYRGLYENTISSWNGALTTDAAKAGAERLSTGLKAVSTSLALIGDASAFLSGETIDEKIFKLASRHILDVVCANGNCENASVSQEFAMDAVQEALNYLVENGLTLSPESLLLTANTLIWEYALIPELDILASDPPDFDYQKIYEAAVFGNFLVSSDEDLELARLANRVIRLQQEVYAYLKAINVSFDRYVTAYENGDADSATRQSFAFIEYLGLYDRKLHETATGLDDLAKFFQTRGPSGFELDVSELNSVNDQLLANGMPSSLLALIDDLGFSQQATLIEELVMSSLQDLMSFDVWDSYGTFELQSELFASAAQTRVSAVPNPGTLPLAALSMLVLIFLRRYKFRCTVTRHPEFDS